MVPIPVVDGNGVGATGIPNVGEEGVGVGTLTIGLIPALPISVAPNGIALPVTPPGDIDTTGIDDEAAPEEPVLQVPLAESPALEVPMPPGLPGNDVAAPIAIPPPS